MIKYILAFIVLIYLSCGSSNQSTHLDFFKKKYSLSNDSLEQTLELFSMNDSATQFTLRVENKYQDTLDSYMSNASSKDGKHFIHNRMNCSIAFEFKDRARDTALLTYCNCPELTVKGLNTEMPVDTMRISAYR